MADSNSRSDVSKVESFGFTGADMEPEANIVAWRTAVATLFDVDQLGRGEPGPFRADLESYAIGPILIGKTRFSAQHFSRSLEVVARSGVDHVIMQLYLAGGYQGVAGDDPIQVGPGDICVFDLANTLDTLAIASEVITLVLPRVMVEARLPQADVLHGLVLPTESALSSLLGRHLIALLDLASQMSYDECAAAAEGTVALALACLQGEMERRDALAAGPQTLSLFRIRRHIDQRLAAPDLTADTVAAAFGMSRATLYRLFAPLGGVVEYIRARRLHRAFLDLAQPGARVSEVARRWRFASEASFARAFKAAYGISPSAARVVTAQNPLRAGSAGEIAPALSRWMRDLAQPGAAGKTKS